MVAGGRCDPLSALSRQPREPSSHERPSQLASRPRHRHPGAPLHEPRPAPGGGAVRDRLRRRLLRLRRRRTALSGGAGGPLERLARVQRAAAGGRRHAADGAAALFADLRRPLARARHRPRRGAPEDRAEGALEGAVRQLRLGGQRPGDQAGLVLPQRHRQAGQEEDHRPPARLSRRHGRGGEPDGSGPQPRRLGPADRPDTAHRLPEPLSPRRARREPRPRSSSASSASWRR